MRAVVPLRIAESNVMSGTAWMNKKIFKRG